MSTLSERLEAARRAALVDESSDGDGAPQGETVAAGAVDAGAAPAGTPANGAPPPSARAERA
ncbi:MAG: hypothetical protein OSB43_21540, partial [Nocardioides sp.]|uniref:hypothetical protein n=1 Tax=Nocardioides sp. TaxID=35761 RepID=UPI002392C0A0